MKKLYELINDIKDLEKIVFDKERNTESWELCPGPDVQYQVNLEYLSKICILLSEKYNEEYEVGRRKKYNEKYEV